MGRIRLRLLAVLTLAVVVLVAAASQAGASGGSHKAPTLKKAVVATGFFPNVAFTPYYVAIDKGYYRKLGLDVTMNYDRVPNLLQQVGDGKYTFASTGGDSAILAKAAGAHIKYVMAQYQQYPVGAMWLKDGGPTITKPADLKGKKIGYSIPNSSTYFGMRALLQAGHLSESDVTGSSIGFAETEALVNHRVDVAMTFIDNEPVQAAAIGHPVNVMPVSKYMKLTSTGLVTSDTLARTRPGLVRNFVNATMKGLQFAQAHPTAAFNISLKFMPDVAGDPDQRAVQRKVLTARLTFQHKPKNHPYGWSDPKGWTRTINFLKAIGSLQQSVKPSSLFTDAYVGKAKAKH